MITVDLTHTKTLKDFYSEIKSAHQKAHGDLYVAHHDKMVELAAECVSYRELGVMQGATAAAVVLAGIRDIHLIDIKVQYSTISPLVKVDHKFFRIKPNYKC